MNADALVRARIPKDTKERAVAALDKMGLSTSDVIRLVMMRVAEEGKLPFEVRTPNAATRRSMAQLESGKGERFESADALFEDLGI
ncbi:type II toxin-antitoxin system RelB/DinJ family antitoxin [Pantoea agglomerans]|jgi:DNA-damage-inducible protein J|uniref:type II toxin-antitoxin system RelB/DinJ family antitoxin n=1 Tax=Enterobacter agglomerans TaxID=549 RepID=UPI003C7AFEBA